MAPTTFSLVALGSAPSEDFLSKVSKLPVSDRLFWIGKCHHWIAQPHVSKDSLTGTGPEIQKWDYLIVSTASGPHALELPPGAKDVVEKSWSITTEVPDAQLASLAAAKATRAAATYPPLPAGWNASDHSGLDAAEVPSDLEASLDLKSYSMGSKTSTSSPLILKDFIRKFASSHTGPIAMFNLLSYLPEQRPRYLQYVAAFQESVGSSRGGDPIFIGFGVTDWSSRELEEKEGKEGKWEDSALIHYPSLWHFGKMLDDEAYWEVDRKYKEGVLRDNPLICCTEVEVEYEG